MMETVHNYRDYVFIINYESKDPAYTVDFPDIPEIITSGKSMDEAFKHACEALDVHLESLQKLELTPPVPKCRVVVESC